MTVTVTGSVEPDREGPEAVGSKIYICNRCEVFWDNDPRGSSLRFANSINPNHFINILDSFVEDAADKPDLWLHCRQIYIQAAECTLALLAAILQAFHYPQGWIVRYSQQDLCDTLRAIAALDPIPVILVHPEEPGWHGVAKRLLEPVVVANSKMMTTHSKMLSLIVAEYLHPLTVPEYNSIKHGLRAFSAPWALSVKENPRSPDRSPEKLRKFEASAESGSHFLGWERVSVIPEKRHFQLTLNSNSWDIDQVVYRIRLLGFWAAICKTWLVAHHGRTKVSPPAVPSAWVLERCRSKEPRALEGMTFSDAMSLPGPNRRKSLPDKPEPALLWPKLASTDLTDAPSD